MANLADIRNLISDAREGKGRFFRQEDSSWMSNLSSDVQAGRRRRYDPKIGMPEVAGASLPAALPAKALWDYNKVMRPAAFKMINNAPVMSYYELEKAMRLGDVGLQGLGATDFPVLVGGSEIAGGQPLPHGFVVGGNPKGRFTRVFHGGSNNFPVRSAPGLLKKDKAWIVEKATHRSWQNNIRAMLKSYQEAKAVERNPGESVSAFGNRALKKFTSRRTSLNKQFASVLRIRKELAELGGSKFNSPNGKKYLNMLQRWGTPHLLDETPNPGNLTEIWDDAGKKLRTTGDHYSNAARQRVTLLMRPENKVVTGGGLLGQLSPRSRRTSRSPLTAAQKMYVHRQLGMDLPANYSTPKAAKAFLKSIFLPNMLSGKPDRGMVNRLCPAGSHMCGSLPAKILKGLGLSGRYGRTSGALPGDMLANLNLKPIGIAGVKAKSRALARLVTSAKRRNIAGVLAALGAAAVGGTGVHTVRNILEKRD